MFGCISSKSSAKHRSKPPSTEPSSDYCEAMDEDIDLGRKVTEKTKTKQSNFTHRRRKSGNLRYELHTKLKYADALLMCKGKVIEDEPVDFLEF